MPVITIISASVEFVARVNHNRVLCIGGDDMDLRITTTGTVGGNGLLVSVSYYTIES